MSELIFNLDVHPKYGFYQTKNDMKCEFMELEGYRMRCNKDIGVFKKGETYLIHSNNNDLVNYYDHKAYELAIKSGKINESNLDYEYDNFFEFVPVEWFENRTFTLISNDALTNANKPKVKERFMDNENKE